MKKGERIDRMFKRAIVNMPTEKFWDWLIDMYGRFEAVVDLNRKVKHSDLDLWEKRLDEYIKKYSPSDES